MGELYGGALIIGTCKSMCPPSEMRVRERQGRVHILEQVPGTEHLKRPRAHRARAVKEFSRPAAGKADPLPQEIRPPGVLLKTTRYLLQDVCTRSNLRFNMIYEFVFDRLRALRQDLVIQHTSCAQTIKILAGVTRFLLYSSYVLCEASRADFDPTINNSHTQECLKRLLSLYDCEFEDSIETKFHPIDACQNAESTDELTSEVGCLGKQIENINIRESNEKERSLHKDLKTSAVETTTQHSITLENLSCECARQETLTYYLLFNLGRTEALTYCLDYILKHPPNASLRLAMDMSFAWVREDFGRVLRLSSNLSALELCAVHTRLHVARLLLLRRLCHAYSAPKPMPVPTQQIAYILAMHETNTEACEELCIRHGLMVSKEGITFDKTSWREAESTDEPKQLIWINSIVAKSGIELGHLLLDSVCHCSNSPS